MLELMARGGMRVGELLKPKSCKYREHVFIPQKKLTGPRNTSGTRDSRVAEIRRGAILILG